MAAVDIVNAALTRISERAIDSLTEDSPAARAANRIYPLSLNTMFGAMDWRFATARAGLVTPFPGTVSYPWTYTFALPDGVARARMVVRPPPASPNGPVGDQVPFEEGVDINPATGVLDRVIRTSAAPPLTLVYTMIVLDDTLWDDGFRSAFTIQLASELALPITCNGQLAQSMRQQAVQAIASMQPVGQAQSITQQSRGPSTTTAARQA